MGKHGPCCHCGITTTPLWRNGPPEKPVLCNACGSRWRTKGTLVNYTPTHSLSKEPWSNSDDFEFKPKPVKFGMKPKPVKFKNSHHSEDFEIKPKPVKFKNLYNSEDFEIKSKPVKFKNLYNSEDFEIKPKPVKFENLHDSEDFEIKPKPVKFKNLHDSEDFEIKPKPVKFKNLHKKDVKKEGSSSGSFRKVLERESREESSCSDSSVRNDLAGNTWVSLVPSKKRTYVSPPSPKKPSHVLQLTHDLRSILHQEKNNKSSKNLLCLGEDYNCELVYKRDTLDEFGYGSVLIKNKDENRGDNLDIVKRDKVGNDKLQIMRGQDSPLVALNLLDLVNYESFVKNLNHEEQQNLFKYLPSIDTNNPPDSLKTLFSSKSFIEALSQFKDKITSGSTSQISNKRPRDYQNHIYTELKGDKRSPKRVCKSPQDKNSQFLKKQGVSCLIPVPLLYLQDNSENDLIMDVPRNAPSPEAELLHNGPFKIKCLANRSSVFVDSEINGESSCSSRTTK